jgi:hypothetical protein
MSRTNEFVMKLNLIFCSFCKNKIPHHIYIYIENGRNVNDKIEILQQQGFCS